MLIALALSFFAVQDKLDEGRVAELIKKLSAEDLNDRDAATNELLALGEAVAPLLSKAMSAADSDTKARLEKIVSEVTLPTKWAKEMIDLPADQAFSRLDEAMRAKSLDKPQLGRIVAAVMSSDGASTEHRQYMMNLIERHRLTTAWPALVQMAAREDQEGQNAAYYLQRMRPPPEAAPAIIKILPKLKNYNTVIQLLEVVRAMKLDKGVLESAVGSSLEVDDDSVKMNILSYIQSGRFPVMLKTMMKCWKASPNLRQSYAREAFLRATPDDTVKELYEMLKSEGEDLYVAIDYIGRQKVKDGAGPLAETLSRLGPQDASYRQRIMTTLRQLKIEDQVKAWLAGESPISRAALLVLAGELDIKSAGPEAAKSLGDRDPAVRRAAAAALGLLKHADAADALEARFKDDDATVRRAALSAFARVKGKNATPVILATLLGDNADLQAAALDVLPVLDADAILDELTKEANLAKPIARYALAVMIVGGGEATLNRVMVRVAGKVASDDLLAMVKLIQAVRTGR